MTALHAYYDFAWLVFKAQFIAVQNPIFWIPTAAIGGFVWHLRTIFFGRLGIIVIIVCGFAVLAYLPIGATYHAWRRYRWWVIGTWSAFLVTAILVQYQTREVVTVELAAVGAALALLLMREPARATSLGGASLSSASGVSGPAEDTRLVHRLHGRVYDAWRNAVATAHLHGAAKANKEDPARVVDQRDTLSGKLLEVEFPKGRFYGDYEPERVASWFGAKAVVEEHPSSDRRAMVRIRDRLPFPTPIPAPPPNPRLAYTTRLGWDEDGEPIDWDLSLSHGLIGGQTRYGKSNAGRLITGHAVACGWIVVMLDGKHSDYRQLESRCAIYAGADPAKGRTALRRVVKEMRARMNYVAREGARYFAMSDLPAELRMPPMLVYVDDISTYWDNTFMADKFLEPLLVVVKQGLAADIHVVIGEQKPVHESLSTGVRDILGQRVAFRCETWEMGKSILGTKELGEQACALPEGPLEHAGYCIVRRPDGAARQGRTFLADADWYEHAVGLTPRRLLNGSLEHGGAKTLRLVEQDASAEREAEQEAESEEADRREAEERGWASVRREAEMWGEGGVVELGDVDEEEQEQEEVVGKGEVEGESGEVEEEGEGSDYPVRGTGARARARGKMTPAERAADREARRKANQERWWRRDS